MDRRVWFKRLIKGATAAVTAALGVPAVIAALSPVLQRRRGPDWRPLGPLDRFQIGSMTRAEVGAGPDDWTRPLVARAVYVWRPGPDDVVVYSRACTDLGCPLAWDDGSGWFLCPCHGGMFAADGQRVAGPPARSMDRYAVRVSEGVLEIDLNSLPPVA